MATKRLYVSDYQAWHLHFVVWRYAHKAGPDQYQDVTSIELLANTEFSALTMAAAILPKQGRESGYVVRQVTEHQPGQCPHFVK